MKQKLAGAELRSSSPTSPAGRKHSTRLNVAGSKLWGMRIDNSQEPTLDVGFYELIVSDFGGQDATTNLLELPTNHNQYMGDDNQAEPMHRGQQRPTKTNNSD